VLSRHHISCYPLLCVVPHQFHCKYKTVATLYCMYCLLWHLPAAALLWSSRVGRIGFMAHKTTQSMTSHCSTALHPEPLTAVLNSNRTRLNSSSSSSSSSCTHKLMVFARQQRIPWLAAPRPNLANAASPHQQHLLLRHSSCSERCRVRPAGTAVASGGAGCDQQAQESQRRCRVRQQAAAYLPMQATRTAAAAAAAAAAQHMCRQHRRAAAATAGGNCELSGHGSTQPLSGAHMAAVLQSFQQYGEAIANVQAATAGPSDAAGSTAPFTLGSFLRSQFDEVTAEAPRCCSSCRALNSSRLAATAVVSSCWRCSWRAGREVGPIESSSQPCQSSNMVWQVASAGLVAGCGQGKA